MKKYQAHLQYALVQAGVWGLYGSLLCYAQNYLLNKNFSNIFVSGILGVASVCSVIFQIIVTEWVNRSKSITLIKVIIALSTIILYACAILRWKSISNVATAIIYALGIVCLQMLPAFVNAMGMSAIQSGGKVNFGFARGIGSSAYALVSFLVGRWIITEGYDVILFVTMVLCITLSHSSFIFNINHSKVTIQEERTENLGLLQFFRHHQKFSLFLIGCIFCAISHSLTTSYLYQITISKGGTSAEQGIAAAMAALLELPAMFLFLPMVKRVCCDTWVKISGLFFTLKAFFIFLAPNVAGLYGAMSFQLLGFALYSVSSVYYAGNVISPKYVVQSQSYLFVAFNIGGILSLMIGGPILEAFDIQTLMLVATAFGFAGFLLFSLGTEKVKKVVI
ncbi:MAG: MFS transporter [Clostridiales bacterium]|nr:MFS transporter [Clostridiales bacterium]